MEEVAVTLRFRPPRPVSFVDLRGELTTWRAEHPLVPVEGGWLETTLRLPPGTYAYKLRLADGEWLLDPENPRTRGAGGARNSLLVVGGAEEPILHAPAAPWLHLEDDGRLCLRAGLRRGAGERLGVRFSEGGGFFERELACVAGEDEHLLFETHLPVSARRLEYLFVTGDGRRVGRPGGAGQAFAISPGALRSRAPAWWREAVVYSIFVDRFRRGGADLHAPVNERGRAGGDLDGVIEALPHLADLGVTALHLTPIATAPSAHRYDAIDPRVVDPALGGEAALARLFEAAHARGLRVLLDVPVTHVSRDAAPFLDVRARGHASPYARWFHVERWPFRDGPDPGYRHYQKGRWEEPLLRLEEPEAAAWVVETFEHWARLGADGFRVDAAADAPPALLDQIARAVRRIAPEAALFGEVVADNAHRFTAALHAATDFAGSEALGDFFLGRATAGATRERLARRRVQRGGPAHAALGFVGNHDMPRLATRARDPGAARLAHLVLLARPEVPAIYYGDEVGLAGGGSDRDFEDAWPDRAPMPWQRARWDVETYALVRAAVQARRAHPALFHGDVEELAAGDDVLAFRRRAGSEVVDVLAHRGEGRVEVPLPPGAASGAQLLVTCGEARLDSARGVVTLGAWSGALVARTARVEATATWRALSSRAEALVDAAYQAGALEVPALPRQLYVTVTEACNLRCAHCITDAPARTRDGRAREIRPWVIDALAEAFAAADYVGFTHGGESLASPRLFDVLAAVGRAWSGRPGAGHIHLLSNGMLLDRERLERLVDHGVTSLGISLDGASERTNDAVRTGARFSRIVDHLREAVSLRARRRLDLRVGVSAVVTLDDVDELPALGRLVAGLGLDWLKVEELVPCTPWARRSLIAPRDRRVEQAMAALQGVLAGSDVVLVDHRDPPEQHDCGIPRTEEASGFRAADDFANRARFRPCRLAWEQACIDPDGTVRPVSYEHAPLGQLLYRPLIDLWNGEAARRARRTALEHCAMLRAWDHAGCTAMASPRDRIRPRASGSPSASPGAASRSSG